MSKQQPQPPRELINEFVALARQVNEQQPRSTRELINEFVALARQVNEQLLLLPTHRGYLEVIIRSLKERLPEAT